jgi:hypothetical protein
VDSERCSACLLGLLLHACALNDVVLGLLWGMGPSTHWVVCTSSGCLHMCCRTTKASGRAASKGEAPATKQRGARGAAKAGLAAEAEALQEQPAAERGTRARTTRSQKARAQ